MKDFITVSVIGHTSDDVSPASIRKTNIQAIIDEGTHTIVSFGEGNYHCKDSYKDILAQMVEVLH